MEDFVEENIKIRRLDLKTELQKLEEINRALEPAVEDLLKAARDLMKTIEKNTH